MHVQIHIITMLDLALCTEMSWWQRNFASSPKCQRSHTSGCAHGFPKPHVKKQLNISERWCLVMFEQNSSVAWRARTLMWSHIKIKESYFLLLEVFLTFFSPCWGLFHFHPPSPFVPPFSFCAYWSSTSEAYRTAVLSLRLQSFASGRNTSWALKQSGHPRSSGLRWPFLDIKLWDFLFKQKYASASKLVLSTLVTCILILYTRAIRNNQTKKVSSKVSYRWLCCVGSAPGLRGHGGMGYGSSQASWFCTGWLRASASVKQRFICVFSISHHTVDSPHVHLEEKAALRSARWRRE